MCVGSDKCDDFTLGKENALKIDPRLDTHTQIGLCVGFSLNPGSAALLH